MTVAVDPSLARDALARAVAENVALHERVVELDPAPLAAAVEALCRAFARGGKVLAFGNGGSAADAQHLAAELVGRFGRDRQALAALALTADASVVTALANDYAFDRVFVRQIAALGRPGDVALGISTSGRSVNVLRGLEAARAAGLTTIALTGGDGGRVGRAAEIHLNVPGESTPRVQEVHRTLLHVLCELVEREVCKE